MNQAATKIQEQKSEELPTLSTTTLPSNPKEVETSPDKVEPVPFEPPVPENVPQRCIPPRPKRKRSTRSRKVDSVQAVTEPATTEKPALSTYRQVEPEHEQVRSGCK